MNTRILLTGSSGYVGSSFIASNINKYKFETFSLFKSQVQDVNFIDVQVVLHCAALVHKKKELPYIEYDEVNAQYPYLLAKEAKKNGVKHFVFLSTIAVYGQIDGVISENSECRPVSNYGVSKLEAEKKLLSLNDNNFVISIIRPSMVYGKEAPGNIQSLIKLVSKLPLLPFRGVCNKRYFVYIGNLCALIDKVIESRQSGVYLAADDESISLEYILYKIAEYSNKKRFLFKMPYLENVLKYIKPNLYQKLYGNLIINNDMTKKKLNFNNPYTVEQGIYYMVNGEPN